MNVKTAEQIDTRIIQFMGQLIDEGYDRSLVAHCMVSVAMTAISVMTPTAEMRDIVRVTQNRLGHMIEDIEKELCEISTKH